MGKERLVNFRELMVKVSFIIINIIINHYYYYYLKCRFGGYKVSFLVQMCVNTIVRPRGKRTCVLKKNAN